MEIIMDYSFNGKKAIIIQYNSFGLPDILEHFKFLGIDTVLFRHDDLVNADNPKLQEDFIQFANSASYDFVFSFNYYPFISICCNKLNNEGYNLKYLSIVYDNPHMTLYSYPIIYPCNYVFVFDSTQFEELYNGGIKTVYYSPLPVYIQRIDRLLGAFPHTSSLNYTDEVSFVGNLYNESHNYYDIIQDTLKNTSPYLSGYLDALVNAQSHIYDNFLLDDCITDEMAEEICKIVPYIKRSYSIATDKYICTNYYLSRKVTEIERTRLLHSISKAFSLSLYTGGNTKNYPEIINKGTVDYYNEMPFVFRNSKINLNISLKSIKSGIPLRAMDIMACGGFLLTNYQKDFLKHFNPGEDFIFFTGEKDLLDKIHYYIHNDAERKEISRNGYLKIRENYSYDIIINQMLDICLN